MSLIEQLVWAVSTHGGCEKALAEKFESILREHGVIDVAKHHEEHRRRGFMYTRPGGRTSQIFINADGYAYVG